MLVLVCGRRWSSRAKYTPKNEYEFDNTLVSVAFLLR